jgi:anti-sigma B factor antagonist
MLESSFKHLICPVVVMKITDEQLKGDTLADALRDEFLAVATGIGALYAVIDFQAVTFIASTGIRPLLSLNRLLREKGGRVILCNLSDNIREIFEVTRLVSTHGSAPVTFEVQADVPSAIAQLYKGS